MHVKIYKYNKNNGFKGFTLLELALSIICVAILTMAVAGLLPSVIKNYLTQQDLHGNSMELVPALDKMSREIRAIRSNNTSDLIQGANTLTFTDINHNTITYALSGGNLTRNSVILATNITALNFTYYDGSGTVTATNSQIRYIKTSVTATRNNSAMTLSHVIFLRDVT